MRDTILRNELAARGVFFPPTAVLGHDGSPEQIARFDAMRGDYRLAADAFPHLVNADLRVALDSQPQMITTPNAGLPILFTNVVDPEVIRVIFTPMRAAQILGGETQKGNWTTDVAYFPMVENTGQTATYGDYSNNGAVDLNAQWQPRQPYHWQTFKRYGEKQVARYGAAGINYASELDVSVTLVFNKFANKVSFYGVAGLNNFGLLNEPSLIAAISPGTKVNTTYGVTWRAATVLEQFADIKALFQQLVTQMGGNIDMAEHMKLVMSTNRMTSLVATNDFGITLEDMLKKAFPNMTLEYAPEYSTGSGELMQLMITRYEGQQTAYPAYTEKQRNHALITEASAWSQKVSAGSFGTILRRPIAIAQMLGI